ncbi:MAG: AAA family ATPase [bacterium]|nr:AAA family ATPase [bacterium]
MRISKISVKNLFGMFNHEIPLNAAEHITIIHGPNGYGKTILLTLVNEIFNGKYQKLLSVPFGELEIEFDEKNTLIVKINTGADEETKKTKNGYQLEFEYSKPTAKPKSYKSNLVATRDAPFPVNSLTRIAPELERIGSNAWRNSLTGERLSRENILEQYSDRMPTSFLNLKGKVKPSWFEEIENSINTNFIKTERLRSVANYDSDYNSSRSRYAEPPSMALAVLSYSKELSNAIRLKLAKYGSLSQSLDSTFPTRLVKRETEKEPTIDELKKELKQLGEKRDRLVGAGIFDREQKLEFEDWEKIDENNINVLAVYIDDVERKLSVFDDLSDRIDLLTKIVNRRFLFKQLSIDKETGFVLNTSAENKLSPRSLSSGEQHELVLLYELLFKVEPNSLILIDEPELSLHVVWQQEFLKDLHEITSLVGFDVLIATHSPQIINDRWDLTVELQGPKQ